MHVVVLAVIGLGVGVLLALIAEIVPDNSGGGRSPKQCRSCETPLPNAGLSQLRTKASTCPSCGEQISAARLPTVITTGFTFALIGSVVGWGWQLIPLLFLASSLIALSAVDFVRFRLPDRLVFPSLFIGVVLLGVFSIANGSSDHFIRGLIAMLGYSALLLIPNLIIPTAVSYTHLTLPTIYSV